MLFELVADFVGTFDNFCIAKSARARAASIRSLLEILNELCPCRYTAQAYPNFHDIRAISIYCTQDNSPGMDSAYLRDTERDPKSESNYTTYYSLSARNNFIHYISLTKEITGVFLSLGCCSQPSQDVPKSANTFNCQAPIRVRIQNYSTPSGNAQQNWIKPQSHVHTNRYQWDYITQNKNSP